MKEDELILAGKNGSVDKVRELLKRTDIDVNMMDQEDWTCLLYVCYHNHIELLRLLLLDSRFELNQPGTHLESTCFYLACAEGHYQIISLLLSDERVDVNKPIHQGTTPFFIACQNGHLEVVRLLLSSPRVNVETVMPDGKTPFFICCEEGHLDILKLLLVNQKITVDCKTQDGKTPFFVACEKGHLELVKWMLTNPMRLDLNSSCNDVSPIEQATLNSMKESMNFKHHNFLQIIHLLEKTKDEKRKTQDFLSGFIFF